MKRTIGDNIFIISLSAVYELVWDAGGRPVYDYAQYNQGRLEPYWQLDLRVDKSFYFKKWTLGLYLDLQNVTFSRIRQPEALLPEQRYELELLELYSGTIVPAVGVTVGF